MGFSDTIFQWLGLARYNGALPSLVDGSTGELQCDAHGRLRVVTLEEDAGATDWTDATALGASGTIRGSKGVLYQVFGSNEGANKRWLQLFDATTTPTNGTIPRFVIPVDPAKTFSFALGHGRPFALGIRWAVSSTAATLTLDSGATFWVNAEHGA